MWKGRMYPSKSYSTLLQEIAEYTPQAFALRIAEYVDDLKASIVPAKLTFTADGTEQKFEHGLPTMPRMVSIESFKAPRGDTGAIMPTEVNIVGYDAKYVTVSAVVGTQVVINVWGSFRFW